MSSYRSKGRPRTFRKLNLETLEARITPTSGLGFGFAIGGGTAGGANATATDSAGNVYVTGDFFNETQFGTISLTPQSANGDAFVAKFGPNGKVDWAVDLGGEGTMSDFHTTQGEGIAVDSAGNVYVTGSFSGTTEFNPNGTNGQLSIGAYENAFVLKLNSSGQYDWAEDFAATSSTGSSIAVDKAGNVYSTGWFVGSIEVDPNSQNHRLNSGLGEAIYVSKLNTSGQYVWGEEIAYGGNASGVGSEGIAVDSAGNVFTTGYFGGYDINFDPNSTQHQLSSSFTRNGNGYFDSNIFVSKLNSAGQYVWAAGLGYGGSLDVYPPCNNVAVDASGNVYTTGQFTGTNVDFDPNSSSDGLLSSSNGGSDINAFVSKLNSSGQFVFADNLGYGGTTQGESIAVDGAGNVYSVGYFLGTNLDFDPTNGSNLLTSTGAGAAYNTYLSKLNTLGQFVYAFDIGSNGLGEPYGIALDGLGDIYTGGYGIANFDPFGTDYAGGAYFISKLTQYQINTTSLPGGDPGVSYDETISVAPYGSGSNTFSITNGTLPTGLNLNTSTGAITGNPSVSGTFAFSVTATDTAGDTSTQPLSIEIAVAINTPSLPNGEVGVYYDDDVSASGGVGAISFSVDGGSLPNGLALNTSTGEISGTPTAAGTYSFKIAASDSDANTAIQSYSVTIASPTAPVVTLNPSNVTIDAGGNTTFSSAAVGNPAPTEQWQVSVNSGANYNNITDGGVYSGATTATLTITGATAGLIGYQYRDVFTNSFGTATTAAALLTVDSAPVVTGNPTSQAINVGQNAIFFAGATGFPSPNVQWMISTNGGATFSDVTNGGVYSGAMTFELEITGATASMNGYQFEAIFSNTLLGANSPSTATTTAATLYINSGPSVTANPASTTANAGGSASFTAAANGYPVPTDQWQFSTDGGATFSNVSNSGVYSGATTATLTISGATAGLSGYQYRDVFTNPAGTATTTAAILTVDAAPIVTSNPTNQAINAGQNATFTAAASGNPTPTVQWLVSVNGGATFSDVNNGGVYSGATSTTLRITGAGASMNGDEYEAAFSNTLAGAGSPSTVTTSSAILNVDFTPTVTTNPTNQSVVAGGNTSFAATATGNPAPAVQWQVSTNGGATFSNVTNGGFYSGATTATLSITGATGVLNGYEYQVVFSNTLLGAGSPSTATSSAATLSVGFPPTVTTNPTNSTVNTGGNTSFTAAATNGFPALTTVQWQLSTNGGATFSNVTNGGFYSGATTTTLTITGAIASQNANEFEAVFSNADNLSATTMAANLIVDFAPTVSANPTNQTVVAGNNTSFLSTATGNPAPPVQWQVSTDGGATFNDITNGGVYGGATTSTLSITGATTAMNAYEYEAVFTNTLSGAGSPSSATTTSATLTVDFAPTVTTNPTNQTILAGANATFTAAATNGNPASTTVQWQASTDGGVTFTNLSNAGFYSGVTTATLTVTSATPALDHYDYRAEFSNAANLVATTTAATLAVQFAPVVTVNPINAMATAGGAVTFSALATGDPAPTVQWQVSTNGGGTFTNLGNGGNFSGVTTDTLTVSGITLGLNGLQFRAVFTNGVGSPVQTTVAVLSAVYQSAYAGQAYSYTYAAYVYAFDAYATGLGSYTAFVYEYYADYFAQYADSYAAAGNLPAAESFGYYAYYYGYFGQYYAYQDYALSGGASTYSYYAYYDGYFGQYYSYYTALGL